MARATGAPLKPGPLAVQWPGPTASLPPAHLWDLHYHGGRVERAVPLPLTRIAAIPRLQHLRGAAVDYSAGVGTINRAIQRIDVGVPRHLVLAVDLSGWQEEDPRRPLDICACLPCRGVSGL